MSTDLILGVCIKFGANPFINGGVMAVYLISKWRLPPSWIYFRCVFCQLVVFGGVPVAPDRPRLGLLWAGTLSYLAVKLFSKNSSQC